LTLFISFELCDSPLRKKLVPHFTEEATEAREVSQLATVTQVSAVEPDWKNIPSVPCTRTLHADRTVRFITIATAFSSFSHLFALFPFCK
jgi:hypothetical protein